MSVTVDSVYADAMSLPDEARFELLDRLLADTGGPIDPQVERAHLQVAKRRAAEILSGAVETIPGDQVMAEARRMLVR